jgi:hypothetical protein
MKTTNAVEGTQELVTRRDQALANIPEYLKAQIGNRTGSENVDQSDLLIPRLAIAQDGMSPQLKKNNEAYIRGLEAGQLFNSVSGEIYGTSVVVVPLFFFKQYIEFVPMNQGGGVVQMFDSKDAVPADKLAFGKDANGGSIPPVVTEFKNRMSLIIQEGRKPSPIVVSFKSSGLKAAKKWNSLIMSTNLPAFARAYKLTSVLKTKGQQTWYVLNIEPLEFVPAEFFAQAQQYFNDLNEGGYKVDTTGLETEAASNPDAEDVRF